MLQNEKNKQRSHFLTQLLLIVSVLWYLSFPLEASSQAGVFHPFQLSIPRSPHTISQYKSYMLWQYHDRLEKRNSLGELIWHHSFSSQAALSPTLLYSRIVLVDKSSRLQVLDFNYGFRVWGPTLDKVDQFILQYPFIITAYDGMIRSLDFHTGRVLWTKKLKGKLFNGLQNECLVVNNATVFQLNVHTGKEHNRHTFPFHPKKIYLYNYQGYLFENSKQELFKISTPQLTTTKIIPIYQAKLEKVLANGILYSHQKQLYYYSFDSEQFVKIGNPIKGPISMITNDQYQTHLGVLSSSQFSLFELPTATTSVKEKQYQVESGELQKSLLLPSFYMNESLLVLFMKTMGLKADI